MAKNDKPTKNDTKPTKQNEPSPHDRGLNWDFRNPNGGINDPHGRVGQN